MPYERYARSSVALTLDTVFPMRDRLCDDLSEASLRCLWLVIYLSLGVGSWEVGGGGRDCAILPNALRLTELLSQE